MAIPLTQTVRPRRGRRRARLALGFSPAALVLVGLIGTGLAEAFRPEAVDPELDARMTLLNAQAKARPEQPLFVVVGSSRIVTGFVPEVLPPLRDREGRDAIPFNFSRTGAGPVNNYLLLSRLFRDGPRPRWALVEVMPGLVPVEDAGSISRRCSLSDLGEARNYLSAGRLYPDFFRERTLRLAGLLGRAWSPASPGEAYGALGGYKKHRAAIDDESLQGRTVRDQVLSYGPQLRDFQPTPTATRAIRDAIDLCRRNGCEAGLLLTPEGSGFRELYGPGSEERFVEYANNLARDLSVPLTDARRWLRDDAFYDSHHPVQVGAVEFTLRLGREALAPMVGR